MESTDITQPPGHAGADAPLVARSFEGRLLGDFVRAMRPLAHNFGSNTFILQISTLITRTLAGFAANSRKYTKLPIHAENHERSVSPRYSRQRQPQEAVRPSNQGHLISLHLSCMTGFNQSHNREQQ